MSEEAKPRVMRLKFEGAPVRLLFLENEDP